MSCQPAILHLLLIEVKVSFQFWVQLGLSILPSTFLMTVYSPFMKHWILIHSLRYHLWVLKIKAQGPFFSAFPPPRWQLEPCCWAIPWASQYSLYCHHPLGPNGRARISYLGRIAHAFSSQLRTSKHRGCLQSCLASWQASICPSSCQVQCSGSRCAELCPLAQEGGY